MRERKVEKRGILNGSNNFNCEENGMKRLIDMLECIA